MTYDVLPRAPGGTYFFTLRLQDRQSDLLVQQVDVLRQAVRVARKRHPFEIRAAVILPGILHMMWALPSGDTNYARRWRMIKSTFSRHVPQPENVRLTEAMKRRREKGIWQRGYWAHEIRDQFDYELHEHLIIHAPVTAGLVRQPGDWALTSLHVRGQGRVKFRAPMPTVVDKPQPSDATLF